MTPERDQIAKLVLSLGEAIDRGEDASSWPLDGRFGHEVDIDSLEMLELVMVAEESAGRQFPAPLLNSIDTIGELAEWIQTARDQEAERR